MEKTFRDFALHYNKKKFSDVLSELFGDETTKLYPITEKDATGYLLYRTKLLNDRVIALEKMVNQLHHQSISYGTPETKTVFTGG